MATDHTQIDQDNDPRALRRDTWLALNAAIKRVAQLAIDHNDASMLKSAADAYVVIGEQP